MAAPSLLKGIFTRFMHVQHEGTRGVICVQSTVPGPVVGITICTHGNEPSGLAVAQYLLDTVQIESALMRGTVYLVLNNLRATEAFFNATTKEEVRRARYCEVNMNRLPPQFLEESAAMPYEVSRARELLPVWKRFDVALDIHSTLENSLPMIISRGGAFHVDLVRGFPIRTLISNIDAVQLGKPAFSFYGVGDDTRALAIEAGQHTDPTSFERVRACTHALLSNLEMLPRPQEIESEREYEEFYIERSIVFPDISYDFVKEFRSFDTIQEGELLAASLSGDEIWAPFDGHIVLPTLRRGAEKDITEEMAFLSRPARTHRLS